MTSQPSTSLLRQMIEQNDEKAEDGHKRLREDYRSLESSVRALTADLDAFKREVSSDEAARKAAPLDASKLVMTPKAFTVLVALVGTIFGATWISTWGLRTDVSVILTRMETQTRVDAQKAENEKLQLDQMRAEIQRLGQQVQQLGGQVQLQQISVSDLKEKLAATTRR